MYIFHGYSGWDRNAVFIGGQLIHYRKRYPEPLKSPEKVLLRKGLVPIVCVGYVDAEGWMDVAWVPPWTTTGKWEPIPPELLFHDPEMLESQQDD